MLECCCHHTMHANMQFHGHVHTQTLDILQDCLRILCNNMEEDVHARCPRILQTTCNSLIRANDTPSMIWVSICYVAHVGVSTLQPMICFQDIVATITLESGTHEEREVSHLFPYHTQWWVNIVIVRDNFHILADVVIVDLICTILVQHASMMSTHVTTITTKEEARSYIE
jgi:hypothetical protein